MRRGNVCGAPPIGPAPLHQLRVAALPPGRLRVSTPPVLRVPLSPLPRPGPGTAAAAGICKGLKLQWALKSQTRSRPGTRARLPGRLTTDAAKWRFVFGPETSRFQLAIEGQGRPVRGPKDWEQPQSCLRETRSLSESMSCIAGHVQRMIRVTSESLADDCAAHSPSPSESGPIITPKSHFAW